MAWCGCRNDADTARFPTAAKFPAFHPKHVFPDERAAIVGPHNQDACDASGTIAPRHRALSSRATSPPPRKTEQARKIFAALQHGAIDRALFTDNANFYFNAQALQDFAAASAPGHPRRVTQTRQTLRGG